jgi:hypothetical protein
MTSLVSALLTNRSPSGPKTRSVGSTMLLLAASTNVSANEFVAGP